MSLGDEQALPAGLRVLGEPREALTAWSCGDVEVSSPLRQDTCRAAYSSEGFNVNRRHLDFGSALDMPALCPGAG